MLTVFVYVCVCVCDWNCRWVKCQERTICRCNIYLAIKLKNYSNTTRYPLLTQGRVQLALIFALTQKDWNHFMLFHWLKVIHFLWVPPQMKLNHLWEKRNRTSQAPLQHDLRLESLSEQRESCKCIIKNLKGFPAVVCSLTDYTERISSVFSFQPHTCLKRSSGKIWAGAGSTCTTGTTLRSR